MSSSSTFRIHSAIESARAIVPIGERLVTASWMEADQRTNEKGACSNCADGLSAGS
jgi:hypothetical protein